MDSILNYLGGKSKLAPTIIDIIPKHTCFIDVFGGAGWVLLAKPREISKVEVLNDLDSSLINLFKVIKDDDKHHQLKEKFNHLLISRETFEDLKSLKKEDVSDIDWAFRYLYLSKWAFSGRRGSDTAFNFGYSKKRYPVPSDKIAPHIEELYQRLKTTYIENLDYTKIFEKYDSEDSLFFIDPPYIIEGVNTSYYKHNMNKKPDHYDLKVAISNLKGKFILTVPRTDFYQGLYKEYNIQDKSVYYSVGSMTKSQQDKGELIITNFETKTNMTNI